METSGVYKIINTVTKDFYIGSSKNIKNRWAAHKCPSTWNEHPNNPLYKDMQKYGVDKFSFQVIEEVEIEKLKEKEQQFIETLKPTYNNINAKGLDVKRYKEYNKKYKKSDKYKEYSRKYQKEYSRKSDKYKESHKKANNKYNNQSCYYNGEVLTLHTLSERFRRAGVEYPTIEAKKYLIKKESNDIIEFYDIYP